MKKYHLLLLAITIPKIVFADTLNTCEPTFLMQSDTTKVTILQKAFDGGLQELAMTHQVAGSGEKITRLSFAGSKESGCHFPTIAALKGGDWGWHVVWASSANPGVFYARVDGEAWVSSLPKRLTREVADKVTLKEVQGKLTITATYPATLKLPEQQFISEDEGRNWDSISP